MLPPTPAQTDVQTHRYGMQANSHAELVQCGNIIQTKKHVPIDVPATRSGMLITKFAWTVVFAKDLKTMCAWKDAFSIKGGTLQLRHA